MKKEHRKTHIQKFLYTASWIEKKHYLDMFFSAVTVKLLKMKFKIKLINITIMFLQMPTSKLNKINVL